MLKLVHLLIVGLVTQCFLLRFFWFLLVRDNYLLCLANLLVFDFCISSLIFWEEGLFTRCLIGFISSRYQVLVKGLLLQLTCLLRSIEEDLGRFFLFDFNHQVFVFIVIHRHVEIILIKLGIDLSFQGGLLCRWDIEVNLALFLHFHLVNLRIIIDIDRNIKIILLERHSFGVMNFIFKWTSLCRHIDRYLIFTLSHIVLSIWSLKSLRIRIW